MAVYFLDSPLRSVFCVLPLSHDAHHFQIFLSTVSSSSSSSSIGTATLVGFGLLNIVEYSQKEGFYRVPLQAARQTPQSGGPVIRTFQLSPQRVYQRLKRRKRNPAAECGIMGEKIAENFAESGDFHVTFGFFYVP